MSLRLDAAIRTSKRKAEARSPQQQRDMIEACAQLHGYEIAMTHDSGRDESGGSMNRATLNAVMERVKRGETDGLIVALTDRLSRAPIDEAMSYVRQLVETHHGVLVLADAGGTPVDLTDPMAETNLVLQLQMARQYRQGTAKRALVTKQEAIRAGKFVGPTPLGYVRRGGRLHEDPDRGPIVRQAFALAAGGDLHGAVSYLQGEVPERVWNTDHVRRLLASRTYLGESRSGELVNETAHDALVTLAVWTAAQTDPRMRRSNGAYPLSHAVHCGCCGGGLTGQLQTVRERSYRRMRCANRACRRGASISADQLETHVHEVMVAALGDEAFRARFAPAGLADAERAWKTAQAEVKLWATMPSERRQRLRATYDEGLDARLVEEEASRDAYLAIERRAMDHEDLPQADELADPVKFQAALRAMGRVGRIVVAPGRGAVDVRTTFVAHQRDDLPGALAA